MVSSFSLSFTPPPPQKKKPQNLIKLLDYTLQSMIFMYVWLIFTRYTHVTTSAGNPISGTYTYIQLLLFLELKRGRGGEREETTLEKWHFYLCPKETMIERRYFCLRQKRNNARKMTLFTLCQKQTTPDRWHFYLYPSSYGWPRP